MTVIGYEFQVHLLHKLWKNFPVTKAIKKWQISAVTDHGKSNLSFRWKFVNSFKKSKILQIILCVMINSFFFFLQKNWISMELHYENSFGEILTVVCPNVLWWFFFFAKTVYSSTHHYFTGFHQTEISNICLCVWFWILLFWGKEWNNCKTVNIFKYSNHWL